MMATRKPKKVKQRSKYMGPLERWLNSKEAIAAVAAGIRPSLTALKCA